MIKFALVLPSSEIIKFAQETLAEHNAAHMLYSNEKCEMEEIIIGDEKLDTTSIAADVIIARGLYAELYQSFNRDIPVVEIHIPAIDLLRTINTAVDRFGEQPIGILGSQNMITGLKELKGMLQVPIRSYVMQPQSGCAEIVDQAVKDGCRVILGGWSACESASLLHVDNLLIATSRETFWNILTEAKRAAMISRNEQEKAGHLKAMLDTSRDGILSFDYKSKCVRMCNESAAKMLGIELLAVGVDMDDAPLSGELKQILLNDQEYVNEVIEYRDTTLNMNKFFIKIGKRVISVMVNFQEAHGIQMLERKIRRKMYNQGHVAKAVFADIVCESPAMKSLIATAKQYGRTDSNTLVLGDSGVGKEILAQSLHNHSRRKDAPFVAVNCAAIPETLLESELFGYAPGAFSGAQRTGKPGYFELAHGGTIFLDEIGELPFTFQSRLLRAIQEREFMRLGGDSVIPVDIRVIAATNRDLEDMVENGLFRQDLYFRLDVLRLEIPPLDKRAEDIGPLAELFLRRNFPGVKIDPLAIKEVQRLSWPGNVRQLHNFCERLAVRRKGRHITVADVKELLDADRIRKKRRAGVLATAANERGEILKTLRRCEFNRGEAARQLHMDRTTLWRKMKTYGL